MNQQPEPDQPRRDGLGRELGRDELLPKAELEKLYPLGEMIDVQNVRQLRAGVTNLKLRVTRALFDEARQHARERIEERRGR